MQNSNFQPATLSGKKVLVLGGSAGIGLAVAKASAENGADVVLVSGNADRLDKAVKSIGKMASGFQVDLSSEVEISEFFSTVGTFDHLVYTAGENLNIKPLSELPLEQARRFFEVRYWGMVAAVKYGAPGLNAGGSIVLTSGAAGIKSGIGWVLGSSICAMMEGFVRAMAIELAPIRVNLVIPGLVRTDLWSNFSSEERNAFFESSAGSLAVKFVAGPEHIAPSYLHLMQQTYMTGQHLVVDGGYVLA